MSTVRELLERARPISSAWRTCSPGFGRDALTPSLAERLPAEYRTLIEMIGPGEGFLGTHFLRLYPIDELGSANAAHQIPIYLPQHVLFGSDGIGHAFLFDVDHVPAHVVMVPFIPLDLEYAAATFDNFMAFLEMLTSIPESGSRSLPITPNPRTAGLELHEVHPIVLGGSPTDPKNKTFLQPSDHAKACTYFNRLVRELRGK